MITRKAAHHHIEGVKKLQSRYLYANLNEEERKAGFVTTPFTDQQLEDIVNQDGLFIAEANDQIMGYAFAGNWQYFEQWPIFPYMTSRFPNLKFENWNITTENSFQYGPICIHEDYRGTGLINRLFEEMRTSFVKKYPLSITFINQVNPRSVKAHTTKLGWEIIDEFDFNNNQYFGLAFDMKKSVLEK